MSKGELLGSLGDISLFIEENQRGGLDYERESGWIYCNIKNYSFVDKDELIEAYPKHKRFIEELSDEYLDEKIWEMRKWEIEYAIECINDDVDGSNWDAVEASKYTYGRSGGWMAIKCIRFDDEEIHMMIEDIENEKVDDWRYEKKHIIEAIEDWKQVMRCKEWIEDYARRYSDMEMMKNEIEDIMIPEWDEEIQRDKDIKMIKKLAKKHGLQVGRRI